MDLNLLYSSMSNLSVGAIIAIVSSHIFVAYWSFVLGFRYRHNQTLSHEAERKIEKNKLDELTESLKKLEQKNSEILKEKDEILKEKDEILKEKNSLTFLLQQRDANRPIRSRPW
ncbi:MAG: hypothetical protein PHX44_01170 [Sulfurimonas sp.]|uniref:hypothetical protein n=1 Tax=Sulfurimonas sp. TaxID=2022749 RepID=UPI00261141B8|nr:hypothetical protein [Sulfurimonas sp.]MDD2651644.1 hypothetical protein [Sulfurimonas sp.]MDD3451455.1 hypothetical protein [Sulfurimonas sp.]